MTCRLLSKQQCGMAIGPTENAKAPQRKIAGLLFA
jgi:hypothetical protein